MAESAVSDAPSDALPAQARAGPPAGAPERGKIPIDSLVRSVATVGALFYVLGFLTTNAYLYKLGVSDFSLLRTRFILTGVLTLAPLVLALIGGIYAALDATVYGSHAGLTTRAYLWILARHRPPVCPLLHALFGRRRERRRHLRPRCRLAQRGLRRHRAGGCWLHWRCTASRSAARSATWHTGENRSRYDRFTERFGVPNAVVETMIFAVAGVVLFLVYIGLFGQYFYPRLPEQLGGGRPRMAQILVSGEAVPAVRELGLDVTEDAPLSAPVQLLWEGEESYVIRLPSTPSRSGRADRAGFGRRCRHGRSSGPS